MTDRTHANRRDWDAKSDIYQEHHGPFMAAKPFAWGTWRIPEAELHVLGEVSGRRVLELGCGGGHLTVALAEQGAEAVGLDVSARQLIHAQKHAADVGVKIGLVCADGANLPFADDSFDVVCSDHGAIGWADPREVIPQVARVLCSGGVLAWCGSSPLHRMCWNEDEDRVDNLLHLDHEDVREWVGPNGTGGVHLSNGETIRVLVRNGFEVEDLLELRPSGPNVSTSWTWLAPEDWSRRWPTDQIWKARRR